VANLDPCKLGSVEAQLEISSDQLHKVSVNIEPYRFVCGFSDCNHKGVI
jgi:hypothetical protein